jgi:hypothetical protein
MSKIVTYLTHYRTMTRCQFWFFCKGFALLVLSICLVYCTFLLCWSVVRRREEYTPLPLFYIGFSVGFVLSFIRLKFRGQARHVICGVLFTLCCGPVLIGPEGSYVPFVISLIAGPLVIMIASGSCIQLALTFVAFYLLSVSVDCFWASLFAGEQNFSMNSTTQQKPGQSVDEVPRTEK